MPQIHARIDDGDDDISVPLGFFPSRGRFDISPGFSLGASGNGENVTRIVESILAPEELVIRGDCYGGGIVGFSINDIRVLAQDLDHLFYRRGTGDLKLVDIDLRDPSDDP